MEVLSILLSLMALLVAILAYARTGGVKDLKDQVANLGSSLDAVRGRTADALNKLEHLVRGSEKASAPDQQDRQESCGPRPRA